MAVEGIPQPDIIRIDENLRLRKYDGSYLTGLPWYRDEVVYYNSEGITDESKIPDENYVKGMYDWFEKNGRSEMYFIEVKENGNFTPIGDAALQKENLPIVIGVGKYRGRGIGKAVLTTLVDRARSLGWDKLTDVKIFKYNTASQRLYSSCGFTRVGEDDRYYFYERELNQGKN